VRGNPSSSPRDSANTPEEHRTKCSVDDAVGDFGLGVEG
jgi:hypothetical protein